jgi:hypothetical protein
MLSLCDCARRCGPQQKVSNLVLHQNHLDGCLKTQMISPLSPLVVMIHYLWEVPGHLLKTIKNHFRWHCKYQGALWYIFISFFPSLIVVDSYRHIYG